MSESYPHPPITEAVIEVRVEGIIDESKRKKASRKLAKFYQNERHQVNKGVRLDLDRDTASIEHVGTVITRSNEDENELLLLGPNGIAVSQLATYPGWDAFFGRFQRDWAEWKSVIGHRKLLQIGLRYLNRIDVPLVEHVARHEQYLTLQIQLPPEYPDTNGYSLMAKLLLRDMQSFATVNSGSIDSPIPGHAGFLLDIDIIRQVDVPQKDADIEALIGKMRYEKNRLFESFITDDARDRFRIDQSLR